MESVYVRRIRWIAVFLTVVPFGCSDPTGLARDVSVVVTVPEVIVGNNGYVAMSANVTIRNGSWRPIGFSACHAGFQRREPEGWRWASEKLCVVSDRRWVNPGEVAFVEWGTVVPPSGTGADPPHEGEYRFVVEILDVDLRAHLVPSETFDVEPVIR